MQVKNRADVAFADFFFIVSVAKECEERTFNAERRLDNIRNVSFVFVRIKVRKILARRVLMLSEIVVCSVRNTQSSPQPNGKRNSKSVVAFE